jgi:hypothetical protein
MGARGRGLIGALVLALAPLIVALESHAGEPSEIEVRAAYLVKLAPFVDWPAAAFAGPADPFAICVVGKDPFGPLLDRLSAGQSLGGRPMVVRRMPRAERGSGCQIMYLGGGAGQGTREALAAVRATPVLTVTDGQGEPGIVDFALAEGRERFRIDDQAAADNGLGISPKLLTLAISVRPRSGSRP